jgi:hypothetical protein
MNSSYKFNFTDAVSSPIDKQRNVKPHNKYIGNRDQFTEKETFCAIMGRHTKSKEEFSQLVHLFDEVNLMNLIGQVKPAINQLDDYYETSLQFEGITREELEVMTSSTRQRRENNTFAGAKKAVWDAGLPAVNVGDNPFDVELSQFNALIGESLSDMGNVVDHAVFSKQNSMTNAYKAVIKTIPTKDQATVNSDLARRKVIDSMIENFDKGKMNYKLSPELYSSPREPGISLPHTLSSREWAVTTTSHLINYLYGSDFLLGVRDKDMQDVRKCRGKAGEYFTFEEDSDSPFSLDVSPSLYCNRYDDEGTWHWRNLTEIIKISVNQEMADKEIPNQNSQQREQILKRVQREAALKIKDDAPDIISEIPGFPYLRLIDTEECDVDISQNFMLLLYKAGFSKLDEVHHRTDYVHLVSKENAKSIGDTDFYKILYPDMNTVLLLPMTFWLRSAWAVSPKVSKKPFISAYGLKLPRLDYSAVGLYFAMFQLSHTKNMLDSWKRGESYDPAAHTQKLAAVLGRLQDDNFKTLFPSGFGGRNFEVISDHLNIFINMFPGCVSGLLIAPELSKQGKTSIKSMQRNAGYARELDQFDTDFVTTFEDIAVYSDQFSVSAFIDDATSLSSSESQDDEESDSYEIIPNLPTKEKDSLDDSSHEFEEYDSDNE